MFCVPDAAQVSTFSTLYSSVNKASVSQSITLTDYIYAGSGNTSPGGSVYFYDGGNYLGSASLATPGYGYSYATFTTSFSWAGNHVITAYYNGNSNFTESNAALTETINAAQTGNRDITLSVPFVTQRQRCSAARTKTASLQRPKC